jgi:2'-5' RNA ligase
VPVTARAFYALPVDAALADALGALALQAASAGGGRALPKANLHATVAFVGAVPRAAIADLSSIGAAMRAEAIDLALDTLGSFRGARVAWIGPSEVPESLGELHASLTGRLRAAGFAVDARPYHPHVTLARHCRHPFARRATAALAWRVDELVLYESISADGGPRYEPLERWRLTRSV